MAKRSAGHRWYRFFRRSTALRRSISEVIELTFSRVMEDNIVDLAAQVSFYFVLSLVPFLIVLAAIVGWLPSTTLWQSFAQWITDYFPNRSRQAVFRHHSGPDARVHRISFVRPLSCGLERFFGLHEPDGGSKHCLLRQRYA